MAERTDDIPLLADHFIAEIAKKDGMPIKKIDPAAMNLLKQYPWSGNVRELRNVIERLMILGDDPITKKNIVQFAPK